MYYLCSENKGGDQLRSYREADLRLCFRICKKPVFSRRGSNDKITTVSVLQIQLLIINQSNIEKNCREMTKMNYSLIIMKQASYKSGLMSDPLSMFSISHLSCVVRNPAFCICIYENKDADQIRGYQGLCFRYKASTILLLSKSEISSL